MSKAHWRRPHGGSERTEAGCQRRNLPLAAAAVTAPAPALAADKAMGRKIVMLDAAAQPMDPEGGVRPPRFAA